MSNEELYVGSEILVSNTDIQSATVEASMGIDGIAIILDTPAAARVKRVSSAGNNVRFAIIIDGELFAAPFVRDVLDDVFRLVLNVPDDMLHQLARTFMASRTLQ